MTYLLLVFVMKYVYIKTPTPVVRAHTFRDSQPTTSLALFKIHEVIEPIIPGVMLMLCQLIFLVVAIKLLICFLSTP